jgi:hypothetical protein
MTQITRQKVLQILLIRNRCPMRLHGILYVSKRREGSSNYQTSWKHPAQVLIIRLINSFKEHATSSIDFFTKPSYWVQELHIIETSLHTMFRVRHLYMHHLVVCFTFAILMDGSMIWIIHKSYKICRTHSRSTLWYHLRLPTTFSFPNNMQQVGRNLGCYKHDYFCPWIPINPSSDG